MNSRFSPERVAARRALLDSHAREMAERDLRIQLDHDVKEAGGLAEFARTQPAKFLSYHEAGLLKGIPESDR